MASIIGKADSTLVNSAYKVALSQMPPNMSGVYSDMLKTVKDFDKEFIKQTNTLFSGINSANEEMLELIAPIDKMLTNGTFSDQDMMTYKTVLDGFRNEYKLIPKGKQGEEARLIWTNKVNRFKNNVATFNKDFISLTSNIAGENYIPGSLDGIGGRDGDTNIKFLNSILRNKNGAEGNKAKMTVDANGNTFFEANIDGENVKMSLEEIKDMLPLKDATSISGVDRVLNRYKQIGSTKNSKYDPSNFSNDIFKVIESSSVPRNAFQTLAHYDYGQGSFYQDLNSPNGILSKTLTQALAGVTFSAEAKQKFDKDGKEGITAGDFTYNNGENRRELIKYIMGNDKVGRKLLSNWYASTVGQTSFNEGKNLILQSSNNKNDNNLGIADYQYIGFRNGKIAGPEARQLKRNLLNGTSFNFVRVKGKSENEYDFIDGAWRENYVDETNKGIEIGTADDMVLKVFGTNDERFMNLETTLNKPDITISGEDYNAASNKELQKQIFDKISSIGINDDNAANNLNEIFRSYDDGFSGPRPRFMFVPYSFTSTGFALRDYYKNRSESSFLSPDDMRTNDLMLINPTTGEKYRDDEGNIARFKTGKNVDNINKKTGLSVEVTNIIRFLENLNVVLTKPEPK